MPEQLHGGCLQEPELPAGRTACPWGAHTPPGDCPLQPCQSCCAASVSVCRAACHRGLGTAGIMGMRAPGSDSSLCPAWLTAPEGAWALVAICSWVCSGLLLQTWLSACKPRHSPCQALCWGSALLQQGSTVGGSILAQTVLM